LREKLRVLPGVRAASLASQNTIPLHQGGWDMRFVIEGRPEPPPQLQPSLQVHLIAPDYFKVMGIPLLQGRDFTDQDNREHLKGTSSRTDWGAGLNSIIIDEEFAKRYWPNQNPLGQRVRLPWGERDTLKEIRDQNVAPDKLNVALLGGFAALALVLAAVGLYGLLAFTVTQRKREIGVRMALGAQRFDIFYLVVGQGMRLIFAGVVLGALASFGLTRILASVLFKVAPADPLTLVTVTFSVCLTAVLACYLPTRRALKSAHLTHSDRNELS
jgi:putative ABC transport system permease protein